MEFKSKEQENWSGVVFFCYSNAESYKTRFSRSHSLLLPVSLLISCSKLNKFYFNASYE